jgi:hypothetical protein
MCGMFCARRGRGEYLPNNDMFAIGDEIGRSSAACKTLPLQVEVYHVMLWSFSL